MDREAGEWFAGSTTIADDWPAERLAELKDDRRVSVVIPAFTPPWFVTA
jgi:hypothetical protein